MNIRIFLLLFVILSNCVHGEIQDFFKPCPNKTAKHKMRRVDFIYMINLDGRPEKFAKSAQQLTPFQIHPYRFSAVSGWELPLNALKTLNIRFKAGMKKSIMGTMYLEQDNGNPRHEMMQINSNYFSHCMSRGSIGIVLSHLSVLQDALNSGYNTIWVMEDDIEVIKNPNLISRYIKKLDALVGKNNWDILFTDPDTKAQDGKYVPCLSYAPRPNFTPDNPKRFSQREKISSLFTKVGARYGAYSMIVRKSGIKKILNFIKHYRIFLPYDMEFYLPNDINMYSLNFDVVSTLPKALSDNGAPNYQSK